MTSTGATGPLEGRSVDAQDGGAADGRSSVTVLGSRVDLLTLAQVLEAADHWVASPDGDCHRIVVTGFHGLWEAHNDPGLHAVLNSADVWVPDGIAPVWVARMRGHRGVSRIPGAALMQGAFERGRVKGYRHYFYGDTPDTLEALKGAIEKRWPGNEVVGCVSPPFRALSDAEVEEHLGAINAARPDFLWVGLGMPKQDRWIHQYMDRLQVPVAVGVGAAFAFVAGTVERAPEWIGRSGLEWLYRLAKEPRKCWRRCVIQGPQFIFHVLREQMAHRKPHRKSQR